MTAREPVQVYQPDPKSKPLRLIGLRVASISEVELREIVRCLAKPPTPKGAA